MNSVKDSKSIVQEAQFIREGGVDYKTVKILAGDRHGNKKDEKKIIHLKEKLEENIYIEIIYALTHRVIRNSKTAADLYRSIMNHKKYMSRCLKRNVGIEVAALDYLTTVKHMLKKPEIIEQNKLEKFAEKTLCDTTTGLYERSALQDNLETEVVRAERYNRPLSLMFCDIDNFKEINDIYGHEAGDSVLKDISSIFKKILRYSDRIYRYGGDEFVCILPETDLVHAGHIALRIRKEMNELMGSRNIYSNKTPTVSIGAVQYGRYGIRTPADMLATADAMMYKAKSKGKNSTYLYTDKNV